MAKIGVISDTHGLLREPVKKALADCDVILHGGDINSQQVLDQLEAIAKTYVVRGNADKEWADAIPATLRLELYGIKIFMIHNQKQIAEDISDCDLVIYGHSHKYEEKQSHNQVWLNPGSCGPRRFTLPVTMATIQITDNGSFEITPIDLSETATSANLHSLSQKDIRDIIVTVMKETDKGKSVTDIASHNNISEELASQICRLYLTHPGVTADGILNKMH